MLLKMRDINAGGIHSVANSFALRQKYSDNKKQVLQQKKELERQDIPNTVKTQRDDSKREAAKPRIEKLPEEIFLPDDANAKKGSKKKAEHQADNQNEGQESRSGPLNIDPETIAWERQEEQERLQNMDWIENRRWLYLAMQEQKVKQVNEYSTDDTFSK